MYNTRNKEKLYCGNLEQKLELESATRNLPPGNIKLGCRNAKKKHPAENSP
jgi:hypothetical protein